MRSWVIRYTLEYTYAHIYSFCKHWQTCVHIYTHTYISYMLTIQMYTYIHMVTYIHIMCVCYSLCYGWTAHCIHTCTARIPRENLRDSSMSTAAACRADITAIDPSLCPHTRRPNDVRYTAHVTLGGMLSGYYHTHIYTTWVRANSRAQERGWARA